MNTLQNIIIVGLILLVVATGVSAQDIQLVHGKRLRTIDVGTFIQVEVPKPNDSICIRCPLNTIAGELISVDSDNLVVRVVESTEYITDQESVVGYTFKKYTADKRGPAISIPKAEVLSIVIKGKNKVRNATPAYVVGDVIYKLAAITYLIDSADEDFSADVANVVAGGILVSTVIKLLSRQPFYMTNPQSDYNNKKLSRELWGLK